MKIKGFLEVACNRCQRYDVKHHSKGMCRNCHMRKMRLQKNQREALLKPVPVIEEPLAEITLGT